MKTSLFKPLPFKKAKNKQYNDELIEELKLMLNSQRIQRLFGSYGVSIIEQSQQTRISNLYSSTQKPIMRTCAVVNFCFPIAEHLKRPPAGILVKKGHV